MRLFEKWVLRSIFGPSRVEVTGEWRKLYNEKLNDLNCSPNIFKVKKLRMRWAGHVPRIGERRGVYKVLVEKPEGTSQIDTQRRRREDNIKMDFRGVGCVCELDRSASG